MGTKTGYISVDTIFAKVLRDLRGSTTIPENDVIEWIGEALGFLRVANVDEEAVCFLEVSNHRAQLPSGLKVIIQIARNNGWTPETTPISIIQNLIDACEDCEPCAETGIPFEADGSLPDDSNIAYYRPYFDLKYEYEGWTNSSYYRQNYTPVRLSNNTFFKSIVAQETDPRILDSYRKDKQDEYTILGAYPNNELLFSFRDGGVAVSYVRAMVDDATGYPLIPDEQSVITAISYYIKWKIAERNRWNGIDGANLEAQEAERQWLKYIRQAINRFKMPNTIDEYQDMMEQSLYLIPRTRLYSGFFGNLGREEYRGFNNPDGRRRFTYNRFNYGY
jgi:hypothetical protein